MAINEKNEKKEEYVIGGDKFVFANDRYVFAECYGEQLRSALQGVLAFSIAPFNGFYPAKTITGEAATVTIKKIGIKFCNPLLPKHCNPELIEEALAALRSDPKNFKLLKVLGEYAKNDLFEQKTASYTTRLLGGLGFLLLFLSFLGTFPALPLILPIHILVVFITVNLIASFASFAAFVVASAILEDDIRGVKFGRWVGDRIKGNSREPANIKELEKDLTLLINESKKTAEGAAKGQLKEGMQEFQVSKEFASVPPLSTLYPPLRSDKDSIPTDQDTASYTYDNLRAYRQN